MWRTLLAAWMLSSVLLMAERPAVSDSYAISLAQSAMTAMTSGGTVSDVTLNGTVTYVYGAYYETGTATFKAKGISQSRVDLTLANGDIRSDVRNVSNGVGSGAYKKNSDAVVGYAQHNCWTDASWFFPVLSSLSQTSNGNFIFKYIGRESHRGLDTHHIQIYQSAGGLTVVQSLSTVDIYLDPVSLLPLNLSFSVHPDDTANINIPIEINFSSYQPVSGILVPFHFQQMLNGEVVLDVAVTSVSTNSGLSDDIFFLQ